MKKYGLFDKITFEPIIADILDEDGKVIGREELRAGTKGAARRLAKEYDAWWYKDGKPNIDDYVENHVRGQDG